VYLRSHGHVVRDDGLFLELELLEDVGLENLLELCGVGPVSYLPMPHVRRQESKKLTEGKVIVGAKGGRNGACVDSPFALDNSGASDEQEGRHQDIVEAEAVDGLIVDRTSHFCRLFARLRRRQFRESGGDGQRRGWRSSRGREKRRQSRVSS
jgi:hypothetical protein